MEKAYFTGIRNHIINHLKEAQQEVVVAMAWFTSHELFQSLIDCLRRNVKVELVLLNDVINFMEYAPDFNEFIEKGGVLYIAKVDVGFMHHKFCVIDNDIAITGSYNWTYYAENRNKENVIITDNKEIITQYKEEFVNLISQNNKVNDCPRLARVEIETNQQPHFNELNYEIEYIQNRQTPDIISNLLALEETVCPTDEKLLTEITDEDLAEAIEDEFGVKYSKDWKRLLRGVCIKEYRVRKGTKIICDWAFADCFHLTNIYIPDSVTKIGTSAFYRCSGLTSIHIPNGVTKIGEDAFCQCYYLTDIHIPESMNEIEASVFCLCFHLTSIHIPNSVNKIGKYAFSECHSLTSIHIPDSVTTIGERAFYRCHSLTNIRIPDGMVEIGRNTFSECRSLTSIHIPDSVTKIGEGAFYKCHSLTNIRIPDGMAEIGRNAFSECRSLTSIHIPCNVTKIGEWAFCFCSALTNIHIPDGVTEIGRMAFGYCVRLTNIHIPNSVTKITGNAFYACHDLTSITVSHGNLYYDSRGDCNAIISKDAEQTTLIAGCKNTYIPDSVTKIGESAFFYCLGLTRIHIPNRVTEIGEQAFGFCSDLISLHIPNSVTKIEKMLFGTVLNLPVFTFRLIRK